MSKIRSSQRNVCKTLADLAYQETRNKIDRVLNDLEAAGHNRREMAPIINYYFMKHLKRALAS